MKIYKPVWKLLLSGRSVLATEHEFTNSACAKILFSQKRIKNCVCNIFAVPLLLIRQNMFLAKVNSDINAFYEC